MTEWHSLCIHLMTNPQHQPMCAINDSGKDEFCCVDCAATKLGRLVDSLSVTTVARMCSFSKCDHEQAQRGDVIDYSGFCFRCLLGTLGYLSTVTSFALFGEDRRIGVRLLKLIRLLAKHNDKSAAPLFNQTYDI
jgi:hypothetical protein